MGDKALMKDEITSLCPLLTPSPPTNALVNPQDGSDISTIPAYLVNDELTEKLNRIQYEEKRLSPNSDIGETAKIHLVNGNHYITLKTADGIKLPKSKVSIKTKVIPFYIKNGEKYFFIHWNWPIIRLGCFFFAVILISLLIIYTTISIITLPKVCNPTNKWYQGSIIYEIFPASFQDSNSDGIGDLRGLSSRVNYVKEIGVKAIRLNSIFPADHYPEYYHNITTFFEIDKSLGSMKDFEKMINIYHKNNISVILDISIWTLFKQKSKNDTIKLATEILNFWLNKSVDGFYLKDSEKSLEDANLIKTSLQKWRQLLKDQQILIISEHLIPTNKSHLEVAIEILKNVDLIDVRLKMNNNAEQIKNNILRITQNDLFNLPQLDVWVHWSLGSIMTPQRVSTLLNHRNGSLGAILFQLMLPGTINIFYGDEIGLKEYHDPINERSDLKHIHHLPPMLWDEHEKQFTKNVLPWLPGGKYRFENFSHRQIITKMIHLRNKNPAIYMNSIRKDNSLIQNTVLKYSSNNILVIERWFPRRNSFLVVSNFDNHSLTVDLSEIFYSGVIMLSTKEHLENQTVEFKSLTLALGETIIIKLDK